MLYLNIRTTYAQIGMRTTPSSVETPLHPAELHTHYRPPSSGLAATQVEIDIDQYPSRKAYGFLKPGDYTQKRQQEGQEGLRENIDKCVQQMNDMLDNGARSNVIAKQAKQAITDFFLKDTNIELEPIPPPKITVTPSRIKGSTDVGEDKVSIQTFPAENKGHPGKVETYLAQKGSVRMWVSEGKYDIYA